MNIPMSWLRTCVPAINDKTALCNDTALSNNTTISNDTTVTSDALLTSFMDKMTLSGTKVEGLTRLGADITGVVVGQVRAIDKHPNADKLLVTQIDIGECMLQIVTGAQNLTVGDYVPVATDGATLAEGKRIKRGKLRGLDSEGMLCDIGELGYNRHDYPEAPENGIYIFQEPQPLGADVKPILQITDEVIDFEVMSNRPDCQSVLGIAREAAAAYGQRFVPPVVTVAEKGAGRADDMISVEIQNPALCPRYIARVVKNVRVAPSPLWLRHRLTASGLRPINNIVDITNYVMLEYGQPLHAFDINTITEKIIVRNARPGEVFTTLDGVERHLDEHMLVIADRDHAVAVAGVMGGENSMVTGDATAILFEAANFNGTSVRLTAKRLGLRTDASARFEKGLDPNLAEAAVNRAMELVELLDCGEVVPGMVDAYPSPRLPYKVAYDPTHVNALLGTDISADDMMTYLSLLGIETHVGVKTHEGAKTHKGDTQSTYEAEIPTYRGDITQEADIAEEIARLYGFNRVVSRPVQRVAAPGGRTAPQTRLRQINAVLRSLGYSEALTYPFEGPGVFDKLLIPSDDLLRKAVRIQNPLGEELSLMRTTTVNGLLEALSVNYNRRNESARLFEAAFAYRPKALPLTELPDEVPMLTIVAYDRSGADKGSANRGGTDKGNADRGGADRGGADKGAGSADKAIKAIKAMDFYAIKGDLEALLTALGLEKVVFAAAEPAELPYMHPGRTATVSLPPPRRSKEPPIRLGYVGELHPQVCENYQIGCRCYLAVLALTPLLAQLESHRPVYKPLPKFPAVQRDLALRVKQQVSAAEVENTIREKGGALLTQVHLFDVYQGRQIEEGYKSMAYTLSFRAPDRTLTDDEVNKMVNNILAHLSRKLDAVLRDK